MLVVYATRAGSTGGIAEFIGEKLRKSGVEVDVVDVGTVRDVSAYDAFVVGSALYQFHWLKEARQFVSGNRRSLAARPVWLFSSGPTGASRTDSKGRDLLDASVSGPREIGELMEQVHPRGHRIFFGAFYPERMKGVMGWFSRMVPKDQTGDFRDWTEIEGWAGDIAATLLAAPARGGSSGAQAAKVAPDGDGHAVEEGQTSYNPG